MQEQIQSFVDSLARFNAIGPVFNQYSYELEANGLRRHNLILYLGQMARRRPKMLLVAEAPGYRGMRQTGVPFASPHTVRTGIDALDLFGEARGYLTPQEFPHIQKEQSGTIVWQTLLENGVVPLIWNAFPFHPHLPGKPLSNRTPTAGELTAGLVFLTEMIGLFELTSIVAVGNMAHDSLLRLGISSQKVRHPAQSGKAQFVAGMRALLSSPY